MLNTTNTGAMFFPPYDQTSSPVSSLSYHHHACWSFMCTPTSPIGCLVLNISTSASPGGLVSITGIKTHTRCPRRLRQYGRAINRSLTRRVIRAGFAFYLSFMSMRTTNAVPRLYQRSKGVPPAPAVTCGCNARPASLPIVVLWVVNTRTQLPVVTMYGYFSCHTMNEH